MDSWRPPLDEFTLRYLRARIVDDREKHLKAAHEAQKFDAAASEMFLVRAEECARIVGQLEKTLGIKSEPPPPPRKKMWPEV